MAEFHSFSGVDIHAVFGDKVFGELQMVSYKIDREKAPVYTMGSPDLRTIARGKRLITGSCVFVVFEKDALINAMKDRGEGKNPHLSIEETANFNKDGTLTDDGAKAAANGGTIGVSGTKAPSSFTSPSQARLADQVLPFDITLVGASEYGKSTTMSILGVELMSEAGGISIDDLVIEKQVSFIARSITAWNGGAEEATPVG